MCYVTVLIVNVISVIVLTVVIALMVNGIYPFRKITIS